MAEGSTSTLSVDSMSEQFMEEDVEEVLDLLHPDDMDLFLNVRSSRRHPDPPTHLFACTSHSSLLCCSCHRTFSWRRTRREPPPRLW